ncbi:MAG: HAD-IA family hydrolase [Gammaproteobacteria bacterium]|nr:HAD-IA family hydrolase [Gammaproteobacteria bacterium]
MIDTLLFDLDGTLIDTAPDMVGTLNFLLAKHGQAPLPYDIVRVHVSQGSLALVKLGFGDALSENQIRTLQQEYLDTYLEHICDSSTVFSHVAELMPQLATLGLQWGIVTNKPGWLTDALLKAIKLPWQPQCIVSGDTLAVRKPHPEPLLHACKLIQRQPSQCVFLGDDIRDVQAGNAAGIPTLIALYGYIDANEPTDSWGGAGYLHKATDVLDWLKQQ